MIKITLSTKLGELRVKKSELSRMTGIRPSTLSDYYHDDVERINLAHFDKICDALGCTFYDLIVWEPNK